MEKLLWSIVRAAHCRNTHHLFAIDALPFVQTESGKRLVRHLLCHYQRYLAGACDPDRRFRDFQNHVVHVSEGYWGGAPRVAHQWYDRLLRYLRSNRYSDAAHAAGVLSHYFTDPFQPLHTRSSDREAVLHRPFEWSIRQSYETILSCWRDDHMRVVFSLCDGPQWLGEAILHGARFANRKYESVLNEFDLRRSVSDPSHAMSPDLRASMAEIFGIAITGWARVIERTAMDAEATRLSRLPQASLSVATWDATWRLPMVWWKRRATNRREQQAVAALYEEYARLGHLQEHLPDEVDVVRRVVQVYHRELQWKQMRLAQIEGRKTSQPTASPAHKTVESGDPATIAFPMPNQGNDSNSQSTHRRAA